MDLQGIVLKERTSFSETHRGKVERLVEGIREAMKEEGYRQAAREFYKFHTGKSLNI